MLLANEIYTLIKSAEVKAFTKTKYSFQKLVRQQVHVAPIQLQFTLIYLALLLFFGILNLFDK